MERENNENMNELIKQYFSKGTAFRGDTTGTGNARSEHLEFRAEE